MSDLIIKENLRLKKIFTISISLFFGTMLIANIILIYLAITSNNGLVNSNPYKYGINYNETLEMKKFQKEIGYKTSLEYNTNNILIYISDDSGAIKAHEHNMSIVMFHPINKKLDFTPQYTKEKNKGYYNLSNLEFPVSGEWEAIIKIDYKDKILETRHRFTIK